MSFFSKWCAMTHVPPINTASAPMGRAIDQTFRAIFDSPSGNLDGHAEHTAAINTITSSH